MMAGKGFEMEGGRLDGTRSVRGWSVNSTRLWVPITHKLGSDAPRPHREGNAIRARACGQPCSGRRRGMIVSIRKEARRIGLSLWGHKRRARRDRFGRRSTYVATMCKSSEIDNDIASSTNLALTEALVCGFQALAAASPFV